MRRGSKIPLMLRNSINAAGGNWRQTDNLSSEPPGEPREPPADG